MSRASILMAALSMLLQTTQATAQPNAPAITGIQTPIGMGFSTSGPRRAANAHLAKSPSTKYG